MQHIWATYVGRLTDVRALLNFFTEHATYFRNELIYQWTQQNKANNT